MLQVKRNFLYLKIAVICKAEAPPIGHGPNGSCDFWWLFSKHTDTLTEKFSGIIGDPKKIPFSI
uniref:Uncharacterized protein n=1 Tax=Nelumbo nucifera TaxID=4432 RepID=A0A822XGG9_NELNU|nr:TPA_asm: hypothetical protein HUJ06_020943 [Nelumbo nucifera]